MPRILLVGIDGASPTLLRRWMEAGELPTLAELCEAGCFGPLRSTPNMTSPSAWTSMSTGVQPGRHGIFNFFDRVPGTPRFRLSTASVRCAEPWWLIASRAGRRVAVLNVPCSWPADAINGVQVAGWLAPSPRAPGFTHPPELADELAARSGGYPLHSDVQRLVAAHRHGAACRRILTNLRRKAEVAAELLARERYDLMTVVFTDTDAAQHYYLHLSDPAHPQHDPSLAEGVGDVVLAAYREVDRALARLIDAGEPDVVLVASDHGARPAHRGELYLPRLFDALGWQARRRGLLRWVAGRLGRIIPAGLKHRVAARRRDLASELLAGDIAWERTRAFSLLVGGRADAWLNVAGRDERGLLPEAEVRQMRQEIREVLHSCRSAATGERLIERVTAREELYDGPWVAFAPDMLVRWCEGLRPIRGLRHGQTLIDRPEQPPLQTGSHAPEGVFIASGSGIRSGAALRDASICDVAATLLHLSGLTIPGYFDGRVVAEVLREPAEAQMDGRARLPERAGMANAVEPRVAQRLRQLGYL
ncbi:MAG: alkaline phosphatase family protein [Armatimonadota bacterium]